MNEPQNCNIQRLRCSVMQLRADDQYAELIKAHCDVVLQQQISRLQQQQLLHDNQMLHRALLHAGVVNTTTQTKLQQLTLLSQWDPLTHTLNRSIMLDRVQQAIRMAKRQHGVFALLFIDLNKFKPINDQYGHAAGDCVLQQVSARLQHAVRDSDAVSRHGGDEFLILLNNITQQNDAIEFALKLSVLLSAPYQLAHGAVLLSASIGIACYPADAGTVQALICHADAAMYLAKQQTALSI
ncbi:MAG: GGDEF domain-containing protein [Rheinheimera sp.]|nr:GGDEF domain-containing protein [Rheinheimera sp.]